MPSDGASRVVQSESERSRAGEAWTVGRDETLSQHQVVLWSVGGPQVSAGPAPWIRAAERRLEQLLTLPPGWDSYGGSPISRDVASRVIRILEGLAKAQTPQPQLVPLSSGGIHIEWHAHGVELSLEVDPDADRVVMFYADLENGATWEGNIGDEPEPLAKVLWRLGGGGYA
jgi:hypothetical protein